VRIQAAMLANCEYLAVPTHPIAMSLIPRSKKPIRFVITHGEGDDCGS
jgi:hypothetical protein